MTSPWDQFDGDVDDIQEAARGGGSQSKAESHDGKTSVIASIKNNEEVRIDNIMMKMKALKFEEAEEQDAYQPGSADLHPSKEDPNPPVGI